MSFGSRITLITGGQRSGKSGHAQALAEAGSDHPVYLATARIWDEEFRERIHRHQADRGLHWDNLEEEKQISRFDLGGRVVLLDCITLWLTNFFSDLDMNSASALEEAKGEWNRFVEQEMQLIVVTNEIGSGVIPMAAQTRAFVDLQGWMNQHIAKQAKTVVHMVCGIPHIIKDER